MRGNEEMAKGYDPKAIEEKWYSFWLENGLFNAEIDVGRPAFSIVIPPPNVTGSLHMGHAFDHTLQDVMCRARRMQGFSVLWLPGTDHAGIATQNVVEKDLAAKGLSRHDLGREAFVQKVWEWKKIYGDRIIAQMKKLGNSCDWRRERFTLDDGLSRAVRAVFVRLYKKGLIYKGKYIVNWCSRCHTALSDLEVEYDDRPGRFYYVRYPFEDGEGEVTVATTRPETILGDVAIAVHPRSEKFRHLIGRKVRVPLTAFVLGEERVIPIIEDNMVDPDFGTGCVKITPAHDPNDFLVGQRHDLPQPQVIDDMGFMNENAGRYKGLSVADARAEAAKDLERGGFLIKTEDITHSVGHCHRCGTTVEPYLSEQWFVRAKPLADKGVAAVKDGLIRWIPAQWEKTYFQWMENIRDWCISRQLWWGHRIPAWTCPDCGHVTVSESDPTECEECGGKNISQDEDVLDTWFSSALWPFSTMGWPDDTPELRYFYPTSLMVTGFDIIFFWVARMIMMGMEFMPARGEAGRGSEPFRDVYIHSLIRDEHGQKMSKSKGNVIDPLDMIDKYGADALRTGLAALSSQGRDILLSASKIETYRFFMNKLWNAARFALMNLGEKPVPIAGADLRMHDRWILSTLQDVAESETRMLDEYDFGAAARLLYDFIWGDLCDWYLEMAKPALRGEEGAARQDATRAVLDQVFATILPLLHPFAPFITEELWHLFGYSENAVGVVDAGGAEGVSSIMRAAWPKLKLMHDDDAVSAMRSFQEAARAIRNLRAEAHVPPQQLVNEVVVRAPDGVISALSDSLALLCSLCRVRAVVLKPLSAPKHEGACLSSSLGEGDVSLPVGGLLDVPTEIARLERELAEAERTVAASRARLEKPDFAARAPAEVVEKERARVATGEAQIARISENLKSLGK
ncbi:MAG: valine--tRNA ligase [Synergistaceae bacterium]|jgi:valyl-tRNA synthetase|nr:valine--tRNA ligase [Synergistaceae bacterium]